MVIQGSKRSRGKTRWRRKRTRCCFKARCPRLVRRLEKLRRGNLTTRSFIRQGELSPQCNPKSSPPPEKHPSHHPSPAVRLGMRTRGSHNDDQRSATRN